MKFPLLLIAFFSIAGVLISVRTASPDSASALNESPLTAGVVCKNHDSVVLEGTAEIYSGAAADQDSDSAVVIDLAGGAYPSVGFGLTGETLVLVPGHEPATVRLELGQGLNNDTVPVDLIQCSFSNLSTESRLLSSNDVRELGLGEGVIGTIAEIETSIHGIIWVSTGLE
jgi:hypothetical protein